MRSFLIPIVFLFCVQSVSAQSFVNGSFETATDSCKDNIPHSNVHNVIPGVYSFGTSQGMDFRANSCKFLPSSQPASARHGSKFLMFGYDGTGGDSFALALTTPLMAGETYRISFSQRREAGRTSPVYEMGYSADSTKFGNLITQGHCLKGFYDNIYVWQDTVYEFTPTVNARFITLKSTMNGEILYIDNFTLLYPASAVQPVLPSLNACPNPFQDHTVLTLDPVQGPYHITVADAAGRIVYTMEDISGPSFRISSSEIGYGTFFVRLCNQKQSVSYIKITCLQ